MISRAALLLSLLVTATALAASPIPPFPPDGAVAVEGVADTFEPLRQFLGAFQSSAGARYHVAVVEFSDRLNRAGPEYGDAPDFRYTDSIAQAWSPKLDTENAVFILLALENRDIIAHPFARWTRLGWEQGEVQQTIDASSFGQYARAGAYGRALEVLVRDIDAELSRRVQRAEGDALWVRNTILSVRARNGTYEQRVRDARYDPEAARQQHEQSVAAVEAASRALEADDLSRARTRILEADRAAAAAEVAVAELVELEFRATRDLGELGEKLDRLGLDVAGARFDAGLAKAGADQARALLQEASALLDARQPAQASAKVEAAKAAYASAIARFVSARSMHAFWTRTVPPAVAVALLALVLFALLVLLRRSARRRRQAQVLVEEWESLLRTAGDNVVRLLDEHALILGRPDLAQRFTGASGGPAKEAAQQVDDLLLLYDCAQRLAGRARGRLQASGLLNRFREQPWTEVLALLTEDEVVARTQDVQERKLFLPLQRETRVKPQTLLQQMETQYQTARQTVFALEAQFRHGWEGLDAMRAGATLLDRLHGALLAFTVSSPYRALVEPLDQACSRLHKEGQSDPIGTAGQAAALLQQIAAASVRLERALDAAKRISEVLPQKQQQAAALLQQLRSEGMRVGEPDFDPQLLLARVDQAAHQTLDAVRQGRDEQALHASVDALDTASELLELLERTRASKHGSALRIAEARTALASLKQRLPEREARLLALRGLHADSALQPALDNVEEATPALWEAEQCLNAAEADLSPGAERYLAAAEQLGRAFELLGAVDGLYAEIDTKSADLDQLRHRAEQALGAAALADAQVARLLSAGDGFATGHTLQRATQLAHSVRALTAGASGARADWVELAASAEQLAHSAEQTAQRAAAEHAAWQLGFPLLSELETRRAAYSALLEAGTDDKEETNARFKESSAQLDQALALARAAHPDWPAVLTALQSAAGELEETRAMAERDLAEAAVARAAIAEADAAIRAADALYRHGVEAEVQGAKSSLGRAQQLVVRQEYEEARRAAKKALREAASARADAEYQVIQREERQRQNTWQSSAWSSGSGSGSRSSGSGFGSRSSGSSFGSRSSGSRSGGSGFGSSSGGSRFGSSSGGSKW